MHQVPTPLNPLWLVSYCLTAILLSLLALSISFLLHSLGRALGPVGHSLFDIVINSTLSATPVSPPSSSTIASDNQPSPGLLWLTLLKVRTGISSVFVLVREDSSHPSSDSQPTNPPTSSVPTWLLRLFTTAADMYLTVGNIAERLASSDAGTTDTSDILRAAVHAYSVWECLPSMLSVFSPDMNITNTTRYLACLITLAISLTSTPPNDNPAGTITSYRLQEDAYTLLNDLTLVQTPPRKKKWFFMDNEPTTPSDNRDRSPPRTSTPPRLGFGRTGSPPIPLDLSTEDLHSLAIPEIRESPDAVEALPIPPVNPTENQCPLSIPDVNDTLDIGDLIPNPFDCSVESLCSLVIPDLYDVDDTLPLPRCLSVENLCSLVIPDLHNSLEVEFYDDWAAAVPQDVPHFASRLNPPAAPKSSIDAGSSSLTNRRVKATRRETTIYVSPKKRTVSTSTTASEDASSEHTVGYEWPHIPGHRMVGPAIYPYPPVFSEDPYSEKSQTIARRLSEAGRRRCADWKQDVYREESLAKVQRAIENHDDLCDDFARLGEKIEATMRALKGEKSRAAPTTPPRAPTPAPILRLIEPTPPHGHVPTPPPSTRDFPAFVDSVPSPLLKKTKKRKPKSLLKTRSTGASLPAEPVMLQASKRKHLPLSPWPTDEAGWTVTQEMEEFVSDYVPLDVDDKLGVTQGMADFVKAYVPLEKSEPPPPPEDIDAMSLAGDLGEDDRFFDFDDSLDKYEEFCRGFKYVSGPEPAERLSFPRLTPEMIDFMLRPIREKQAREVEREHYPFPVSSMYCAREPEEANRKHRISSSPLGPPPNEPLPPLPPLKQPGRKPAWSPPPCPPPDEPLPPLPPPKQPGRKPAWSPPTCPPPDELLPPLPPPKATKPAQNPAWSLPACPPAPKKRRPSPPPLSKVQPENGPSNSPPRRLSEMTPLPVANPPKESRPPASGGPSKLRPRASLTTSLALARERPKSAISVPVPERKQVVNVPVASTKSLLAQTRATIASAKAILARPLPGARTAKGDAASKRPSTADLSANQPKVLASIAKPKAVVPRRSRLVTSSPAAPTLAISRVPSTTSRAPPSSGIKNPQAVVLKRNSLAASNATPMQSRAPLATVTNVVRSSRLPASKATQTKSNRDSLSGRWIRNSSHLPLVPA